MVTTVGRSTAGSLEACVGAVEGLPVSGRSLAAGEATGSASRGSVAWWGSGSEGGGPSSRFLLLLLLCRLRIRLEMDFLSDLPRLKPPPWLLLLWSRLARWASLSASFCMDSSTASWGWGSCLPPPPAWRWPPDCWLPILLSQVNKATTDPSTWQQVASDLWVEGWSGLKSNSVKLQNNEK